MHGLILAAGKGKRMKGLTKTMPKALVEVAGKTLLEHGIKRLQTADIKNISIAVGWKNDMIRDAIAQFEKSSDINIIDIPNYEIGPLQTLATSLDSIKDDVTVVCPVDLLISSDAIKNIIAHYVDNPNSRVILAIDSQASSGSTVSVDKSGNIMGVQKEIQNADVIAKSAMFMVVAPGFLEYCQNALDNGATTAVSALNDMINGGDPVLSYSISEKWFDIDTIGEVIEANRYFLESAIVQYHDSIFVPSGDTMEIGDTLRLDSGIKVDAGVSLKGPCLINGESTISANCIIGPFVSVGVGTQIGDGCEIQNAVISKQSKIPNHSKLRDVIVAGSEICKMEE